MIRRPHFFLSPSLNQPVVIAPGLQKKSGGSCGSVGALGLRRNLVSESGGSQRAAAARPRRRPTRLGLARSGPRGQAAPPARHGEHHRRRAPVPGCLHRRRHARGRGPQRHPATLSTAFPGGSACLRMAHTGAHLVLNRV